MKWVYLLIAILTEVVATGAGYLVAFYCLSLTLREMPVGVAYAIWCGMGIVLVSLAAALLFGQRLDMGGDRRHGADHSRRNRDQRILQNRRKSLIW